MTDPANRLTHLDPDGRPRMVDVSRKGETQRRAVAEGAIRMGPETLSAITRGASPKGDVLQVARIAGIQAGKRSGELIPLCHPVNITSVDVRLNLEGTSLVRSKIATL